MNNAINEYAEALFDLAAEAGSSKQVLSELELVNAQFGENPEFLLLLSSPAVSKKERLEIIERAFGKALSEDSLSLLKLLCSKGRIAEFSECAKHFRELYNLSENAALAKITSAVELDDTEKKAITDKLCKISKKTILPEFFIDPSILGGVKIELDGSVIDGSIKVQYRDVIGK